MAMQQKDFTKGSAVQILNKLRIEYDSAAPTYTVMLPGMQQELPPFEATCEIFKDNVTYACIGEPAFQKKIAKQNAAAKILKVLSTRYIFLEDVSEKCLVTKSKFLKISDKNGKRALQKWTNSCERRFQKGHSAQNCRSPLRNQKYKNTP